MNKAYEYIAEIERLIEDVKNFESANIEAAAAACADTLCGDGLIFTFGTGHSHMLAEEIFYRAGGLVRVYPILDTLLMLHASAARSSSIERLHGYAKTILDDIDSAKAGDVMFIFSNSGRNTVSIDMALLAHERGLKTLCITNLTHSKSVTSRHSSGLRLYEVCDIVIDNHGCTGDAAIQVDGLTVSPTSTVIGAMIMQAIVARTVEILHTRAVNPEVFISANTDEGDRLNSGYIMKYKHIIKHL